MAADAISMCRMSFLSLSLSKSCWFFSFYPKFILTLSRAAHIFSFSHSCVIFLSAFSSLFSCLLQSYEEEEFSHYWRIFSWCVKMLGSLARRWFSRLFRSGSSNWIFNITSLGPSSLRLYFKRNSSWTTDKHSLLIVLKSIYSKLGI